MSERNTLEALIGELIKVLSPLTTLTPTEAPVFLAELGLQVSKSQANAVKSALTKTANAIGQLVDIDFELNNAIESQNLGKVIEKGVVAIDQIAQLISGFGQLKTALATLNLPDAGPIVADLPKQLFNYLLARYLGRSQGTKEILQLTGILRCTDHNVGVFDPQKPFYTTNEFHFERISGWLGHPSGELANLYGWGTNGFDGKEILAILDRIVAESGLPTLYDPAVSPPRLDLVFVELLPRTDLNPRGIELRLNQGLSKGSIELSRQYWATTLNLHADVLAGTSIVLQPSKITINPPEATKLTGKVGAAAYSYRRTASDPLPLLSIAGGSRVSVEEATASLGLVAGSTGEAQVEFGADLKRGKVLISTEKADGFIADILDGFSIESNFDLGFAFSPDNGLHVRGSGALEIQLASHISLGLVELTSLTMSIRVDNGKFPVGIATDIKATLGPLVAVVEGMGFEVSLALSDTNSGNLGPLDFDAGLKPPKGVSLSLDVGVIKGGGYLYFDADRGEYTGALELVLAGFVNIKSIGLITTKMPDGSEGFSLLIILTAGFGSGIQLGFGFALLEVGGLLGLNRTMDLQALMEGVRTGALNSIMFPKDVIANAPKIISDLRTFFPPHEGIFLIGPMAKLGWGTPALISVSLGIIIEIPGNVAIVGVLRVALPADDVAIIVLQVNFAGAIEFDRQRVYFFAALFESRILFLTIDGEMGLLVAFGDDANFVLSVGGFHPSFSPPPLPFPSPKRVSISLVNSPLVRVRVEGYFAVTSNTVQFGARAELFFGLDEINAQGHIAFDALFQFSPFHFIIQVSASFSVEVFGVGLFSIRVCGSLEGPTPWRARGEGSISILFFDIDVDIDTTWGESRDTNLPPITVMPLLKAEFEKPENWRALLPSGANLLVSLRGLPPVDAALVLHPVGVLRVSQRRLPLELTLAKVGNQKPNDVQRLRVAVAGSGLAKSADTFEQFAPAQFQDLSDAERLSRPAFAPERGGLELSAAGQQLATSRMVKRVVRYEEIIIDSNFKRFTRRFSVFVSTLFYFFLNGASISKSELSGAKKQQLQPFDEKITVSGERYVVASQSTNKAHAAEAKGFLSEASAREYLKTQIAQDVTLAESLHVIPAYEEAA